MSIIKQIIEDIKISYESQKEISFKEKFRNENIIQPIEKEIFDFIKIYLSEDKIEILESILSCINEIQRTNNISLDEKSIENKHNKNTLLKNNYEVFMMNSCSSTNKLAFISLNKKEEFNWFKLIISYENGVSVDVVCYIVDQDALFLDFNNDVIYPIENNMCDCEYKIELVKINDF